MSSNSPNPPVKEPGRLFKDFVEYFDCFYKDPDPKVYEPAADYRWKWRPVSQNPFGGDEPTKETPPPSPEDPTIKVNEAPKWVHLFYDLAWTTTFSGLTQNGRFNQPWDTISYLVFFILVWWVWAAQAMYTIHFYTNDWFHFGSNIVQLCIFGMLAATTRYDIGNYIDHSPGAETLEDRSRQMSDLEDPKVYNDESVAMTSLQVIAISITISRIVLLIQYLRVVFHARVAIRKGTNYDVLQKICVVPIGIALSIPLFVAAWITSTSGAGKTPYGARLKFIFWGVALIVEISSHVYMAQLPWHRPPAPSNLDQSHSSMGSLDHSDSTLGKLGRGNSTATKPDLTKDSSAPRGDRLRIPYSNVTLAERLEAITTIILGEGINGIAGTLWAVISSPGYEKSVTTNAISAAVTVCFITYFYFEGPVGLQHPKGTRQMIWLLLHLPFLLGIILLLLGVKDQFLLTSFLSTVLTSLNFVSIIGQQGISLVNQSSGDNAVLKEYFIKRGIKWLDEWQNLTNKTGEIVGGQMNQTQNFEVIAWQWRLAMKLCISTFQTFMGEERDISDDIQARLDFYYTNRSAPVLDNRASLRHNSTDTMEYYKILSTLLESNVTGARYIIGLSGGVFIFLALLTMVRSKPRDRFQWGIVLSRFTMGWTLVVLLLLNLGRYQTLWIYPEQKSHQAGVFRWLTVHWALPTIALAHFVELIVETFITGLARLRIDEITEEDKRAAKQSEAVQALEMAQGNGSEITEAMRLAAEPHVYVRPPLRELAWRKIQPHVLPIWDRAVAILVRRKSKEPSHVEPNQVEPKPVS